MASNQISFETLQSTISYLKSGDSRILDIRNFQGSKHENWVNLSKEIIQHSHHIDLNLINNKRHPYIIKELEKWIYELKYNRDEILKDKSDSNSWRHTYEIVLLGYELLINELQKKIPVVKELSECKTFMETIEVKDKYNDLGFCLPIGNDDPGFNKTEYFTFQSNKVRKKIFEQYQNNLRVALMQSGEPSKTKITQYKSTSQLIKENELYRNILRAIKNDKAKDYLSNLVHAEALGHVLGLVDFQNELSKDLTFKEMGIKEIKNFKRLSISEKIFKHHLKDNFTDLDITTKEFSDCEEFKLGESLCDSCYFSAFTEKLIELPHSKRKKFIEYQTSIRNDKLTFLEEVSGILNDYESQFNTIDNKIASEFNKIINSKISEIKSPDTIASTNTLDSNTPNNINENIVYKLPDNFKLTKLNIKIERLDAFQSAILFHYLRSHKAVINYSDKELAEFVHYLTGHSEQNLRTKKGFGAIWDILKEERNGEKYFNAKAVKSLLQDIINDIDTSINQKK